MDLLQKLTILADSAKYDVACTSSGADRKAAKGALGNTLPAGCCHSFSADGRCISLLKVLMTNSCIYDCRYCVNRVSNDTQRTAFTPEELAELTIQFYRRNYIEGLFLSSGVLKNPDYTMEQMIKALELLRNEMNFKGYIHAKAIPGSSPGLIYKLGILADRLSVNIELPSEKSLKALAPAKTKDSILTPMGQIAEGIKESKYALTRYSAGERFASAGHATQMIIGASPERDYQIISLAEGLYNKYSLKRVFYSAYIPAVSDSMLPSIDSSPPLLREHRLYQADFLMRMYEFTANEILNEENQDFNPFLDPKCNWAINNLWFFPVDVNKASLRDLLRVPGIGPISSRRIITARSSGMLGLSELKRMGVVLKRAQYFIVSKDNPKGLSVSREETARILIDPNVNSFGVQQLSLYDFVDNRLAEVRGTGSVNDAIEEAVLCLSKKI